MNVVGLDLSLTATGVAGPAGTEVLRPGDLRGCDRLTWLRQAVLDRCRNCWTNDGPYMDTADIVVLEDYAYSRANQAHQIGELHGVIRLALHEAEIPVALVAPTARAKYATGKGNAGKAEVLAAAIRRLGYDSHDDNEADALWLRQMAIDHYGLTLPSAPMPAANREALGKVDWPEIGS